MSEPIFSINNTDRKPKYSTSTIGYTSKNGDKFFKKIASTPEAKEHIKLCYKNHLALSKATKLSFLKVVPPKDFNEEQGWVSFDYVDGISLEQKLVECILSNNHAGVKQLVATLKKCISELSKASNSLSSSIELNTEGRKGATVIDVNLDNIIEKGGELHLIDCEWVSSKQIKDNLLADRALHSTLSRINSLISVHSDRLEAYTDTFGLYIPGILKTLKLLPIEDLKEVIKFENTFQKAVKQSDSYSALGLSGYKLNVHVASNTEGVVKFNGEITAIEAVVTELNVALEAKAHEAEALQAEVNDLKESVQLQSSEVEGLSGILHSPVEIAKSTAKYILKKVKAKK